MFDDSKTSLANSIQSILALIALPKKEKELTDEGSHSLFGVIWQIATETGWSYRHIMWKISFDTITRMVADAPVRVF